MDYISMFAQLEGLPPTTAAWIGTGLLALVLAWLLQSHLPAMFKAQADTLASNAKTLKELADAHTITIKTIIEGHAETLKARDVECAKERTEMQAVFTATLSTVLDRSDKNSERWISVLKEESQRLMVKPSESNTG